MSTPTWDFAGSAARPQCLLAFSVSVAILSGRSASVGGHLLIGDLPLRQHVHQLLGSTTAWIYTRAIRPDIREFSLTYSNAPCWTASRVAISSTAGMLLQLVAKVVTYCGLQHLVDEVRDAPNHGDDIRSLGVWNVNCTCRSMASENLHCSSPRSASVAHQDCALAKQHRPSSA